MATQEEEDEQATEEERGRENPVGGGACASPAGVTRTSSHADGLRHHGDPAEPEEGKSEEPQETEDQAQEEDEGGPPAKLIRAPRAPSQSERELHEALHLPHAEWCEYCVRGRGRNKPHKSRKKRTSPSKGKTVVECPWEDQVVDGQEEKSRAPKVSLDYFFLGADKIQRVTRNSAAIMST